MYISEQEKPANMSKCFPQHKYVQKSATRNAGLFKKGTL